DQACNPPPLVCDSGEDNVAIEPTLAQACSTDRCELDVQLAEPPHDERQLVGVATGIGWTVVLLGDPDVGHSVEDPIQRDSALRTGERRTRAGMDAADERDLLAHVMTIGTECVGIFELTLISVARSGKEAVRRGDLLVPAGSSFGSTPYAFKARSMIQRCSSRNRLE